MTDLKKSATFVAAACLWTTMLSLSAGQAIDLKALEAGDFSAVARARQAAINQGQPEIAAYFAGLEHFYSGRLLEAQEELKKAGPRETGWMLDYLDDVLPVREPMVRRESEHFTLRLPDKDAFLAPYAFVALEKAYKELGSDFGLYPDWKVPVEIYPTQEAFSKASTLSKEILDRSGAVGICKFRRLMILSPEQLAYGFRWLDTLSHEYAHYLINLKSRGQCPLWLHEGIAKYIETRWRTEKPDFLTPGNRTELARALKDETLIPFARMEPSMVYLKNQEEVRLAFSQVSHAVGAIESMKDRAAIMKILAELAAGKSRSEAFESALGLNDQAFESKWKEKLRAENLAESPGAAPDVIALSGKANEVDDLVRPEARVHLRLGDRMQKSGRPDAALIQYEKALEREPGNPVALVKAAKIAIAQGKSGRATELLERCVRDNPNYPTGLILLGREKVRLERWSEARALFEAANGLNPFNPEVHRQLAVIYARLGESDLAERETEAANSADAALRR